MPDLIEELRQQRALLRQHLDWIDRKIDELDPVQAKKETAKTPELENSDTTEEILPEYTPSQINVDQLKLGCIALIAIAALLFLFLLFGLPYLIG